MYHLFLYHGMLESAAAGLPEGAAAGSDQPGTPASGPNPLPARPASKVKRNQKQRQAASMESLTQAASAPIEIERTPAQLGLDDVHLAMAIADQERIMQVDFDTLGEKLDAAEDLYEALSDGEQSSKRGRRLYRRVVSLGKRYKEDEEAPVAAQAEKRAKKRSAAEEAARPAPAASAPRGGAQRASRPGGAQRSRSSHADAEADAEEEEAEEEEEGEEEEEEEEGSGWRWRLGPCSPGVVGTGCPVCSRHRLDVRLVLVFRFFERQVNLRLGNVRKRRDRGPSKGVQRLLVKHQRSRTAKIFLNILR